VHNIYLLDRLMLLCAIFACANVKDS